MDPNETLEQLRGEVELLPEGMHSLPLLIELWEGLDTWLSAGGFLPSDWARNR